MQPLKGIALKVCSVCTFMCMASLIKATSADVPPGEAVFFRSFFAVPVIFVWLAMRGELRDGWKTKNPMGHVWRGIIGTLGMGFGFTALGLLPLPLRWKLRIGPPVEYARSFEDEPGRFEVDGLADAVRGRMQAMLGEMLAERRSILRG